MIRTYQIPAYRVSCDGEDCSNEGPVAATEPGAVVLAANAGYSGGNGPFHKCRACQKKKARTSGPVRDPEAVEARR